MITDDFAAHIANQGYGHILTQAPVDFDTDLAALWQEVYRLRSKKAQQHDLVVFYVAEHFRRFLGKDWRFKPSQAEIAETLEFVNNDEDGQATTEQRNAFQAHLKDLDLGYQVEVHMLTIALYNDTYRARGSWNRAYLVVNGNGHVHSSMECHTCRPTTEFYWVTEYSDHAEDEIVEAAGWRACTVCYPSAPVLKKSEENTRMFTPDEREKQKAREERAAKKAAAEAAQITVEGYYDWSDRPMRKTFKSERAVTNAIASDLSSLVVWGPGHPDGEKWKSNVTLLRQALANKGVEYDFDKALETQRKKIKREGGSPQF